MRPETLFVPKRLCVFLSFNKPITMTEAMKRCDGYFTTIHNIFKLFKKEGLIKLYESRGREKWYVLTEKGKKLYNILIQVKEFLE